METTMSVPSGYSYTDTHEWVLFTGEGRARVGLTDYAQNALGDIVYVNLCGEGEALEAGAGMGDVESIKTVSEIYSPLSGVVERINADVADHPELINQAPYATWLVEMSGDFDRTVLMTAEEYEKFLEGLE
jgi:glycine cleavage system H protein